jgi:tetratricopeptide (TPR) repeat protein
VTRPRDRPAPRPDPASVPGPGRGASIGRYLVLERAGQGGMATVLVAYDPELDRKVALKLWLDDGSNPEEGALRILREARALARLSHPHVVPVYDVGEHEGGVYMAMELVDGQTLRAFLGRPRPWREVLRLLLAAGRGLQAAHAAGVVHRDFNPSNVMIGSDGRVRVVDFGLARPGEGSVEREPSLAGLSMVVTQGALLGTPAYMAPEQHDGRVLDARADQFSFCATLHEGMHGVRPFAGETPQALREAIARGELQRPASGRLPRELCRIVERGLAEDPGARHPSMAALLGQLERVLRRRGRRVRWAVLGSALALSSVSTWVVATREPPAAVDEVQTLVRQARDAAAKVLFVYPPPEDPAEPTAFVRVRQLEALAADGAPRAAVELRQEFAATLRRVGDEYWEREGGVGFAMDYYAQALVFVPDDAHARARTSLTPGELASLRDKAEGQGFSEAELDAGALLAALALPDEDARREAVARHHGRRPRARALSTALRLEALAVAPDTAGAEAVGRGGGVVREGSGGDAPGPEPDGASAEAVHHPHDAARASEGRSRGNDVAPARARRDPEAARALVQAAAAAIKRRDHDEATRLLHQALAADPRSVDAVARLSDLSFDRGHYDEAARWARRAVALAPRVAAHHMRLGDALFKVLRYAEARQAYAAAHKLGSAAAAGRLRQIDDKLGSRDPGR